MSKFGSHSEVNAPETKISEINENPSSETGGEASDATQDVVAEQANETGGFENNENLEPFTEIDKKEIIKDFLSSNAGKFFALANLGYEGFKLIRTLQGDPQCPGSNINISSEMLSATWNYAKCWWETRKNSDSTNLAEIDSPYGIINMDSVNKYQGYDEENGFILQNDENKIGFDFDDELFS